MLAGDQLPAQEIFISKILPVRERALLAAEALGIFIVKLGLYKLRKALARPEKAERDVIRNSFLRRLDLAGVCKQKRAFPRHEHGAVCERKARGVALIFFVRYDHRIEFGVDEALSYCFNIIHFVILFRFVQHCVCFFQICFLRP